MKKIIFGLALLFIKLSASGQIDTTIYGIARNSSPPQIFLAKINQATGLVSNISSSSLATSIAVTSTTVDPYKKVFYFISDGKFIGIDMQSGNMVTNPVITNSNGTYFDGFLFNCSDSTICGLARKSSPAEIYFAKINPSTGVVTNISTTSIATSISLTFTTIDPYNNIYYFVSNEKFIGVDLSTGAIVTDPVMTNTNGAYFGQFLFNNGDYTIYGLARKSSPPEVYLAKINPSTGVVTNISDTSVAAAIQVTTTVIDPFKGIYYFITNNQFTGLDLSDGKIVSSATISNPNAAYFDDYRYCGVCDMYALRKTAVENKNAAMKIHVYPNPAADKIFIEAADKQNFKLEVFNTFGQCLIHQELNAMSHEVNINALSSGIYILKLTGKTGTIEKKIIKQ